MQRLIVPLTIALAAIVVLMGCDSTNNESWSDWKISEFTFDPFPEIITVAPEFERYHISVDSIKIVTSVEGDYSFSQDPLFYVVKLVGGEWRYPPYSIVTADRVTIIPPDASTVSVIKNEIFDWDSRFADDTIYTNGHLAAGTYRIYREFRLLGEYNERRFAHELIWEGYVWAEFEVYE